MTTLAIIGSGIAGRSLLYTLAKEKKVFSKITLFDSDSFAFPCSLRSTAIVAARGVTSGHSVLGDLLVEGYTAFKQHVENDSPVGVYSIKQVTGASTKLDAFKSRYPDGETTEKTPNFLLKEKTYLALENAFLIDPPHYLNWLLEEAKKTLPIEVLHDFISEVTDTDKVLLKSQNGSHFDFDHVVFTTGSYSRFFHSKGKPVQGSYLEFIDVDLGTDSFSLTLEGDNLIYHQFSKTLLMGSTTTATHLELPPMSELKDIYQRLSARVDLKLPPFEDASVRVGLREKASKREPYLFQEGKKIYLGGFYKNGFSLGLKMSRTLSHQFLSSF